MVKSDRWFAALWDHQSTREGRAMRALRKEAIGTLHGRVLEIGVGVGSNWPFVPADVEYTGIEPNEAMLKRARKHASDQGRSLDLELVDVQEMPFPDGSFDIVYTTITFCSVADPVAGLAEVRRVLRPGGEFRFLEHVRAESPVLAKAQSLLGPLTRRLGGGCSWDRDTLAAIEAAGFELQNVRHTKLHGLPAIIGSATKLAS